MSGHTKDHATLEATPEQGINRNDDQRCVGRRYAPGDIWEGMIVTSCKPWPDKPGLYDARVVEDTPENRAKWRTPRYEADRKAAAEERAERKRVALLTAQQFLAEVRADLRETGEEWLAAEETADDAAGFVIRGKTAYVESLRADAAENELREAKAELKSTPSVAALERCLAGMVKVGLEPDSSHQHEDEIRAAVLAAVASWHSDSAELARLALTTADMDFDRWYS